MAAKKALVLDDDRINRQFMKDLLEEKQLEVSAFPNPHCVLELWEQIKLTGKCPDFDLILTDNRMPGMTGLEFLARIKEQGCDLPEHRKAVISGTWTEEELHQAQKLGCRVFQKPSSIESIFSWIDE